MKLAALLLLPLAACATQPPQQALIWCRPAGYDVKVTMGQCQRAAMRVADQVQMPTTPMVNTLQIQWNPGTMGPGSVGPYYELETR